MRTLRSIAFPATVCAALTAACNLTPGETTETGGQTGTETEGPETTTETSTEDPTSEPPTTTIDDPTEDPTEDPTTTESMETTDEPSTDTVDPTETGGGDGVTIYKIQQGEVPENTIVTLKGVVVTSPVQAEDGALFVQEAAGGEYSGIYLYLYDEVVMGLDVQPGAIVDVTGEYVEFNGNSQLRVVAAGDIVVTGQGDPPAPAVVPAADIATGGAAAENWESVLVSVENVAVTEPGIDIGEFEVEGGLRVSDFFLFPAGIDYNVLPNQQFTSITGPLLFSFDNFKIAPRTEADLVSEGNETMETTIFDIQQDMFPVKQMVIVKGVVVTSPLTFKKDGFFVQDPAGGEFSGIYVYIDMNVVDVKPGDIVDIEGQYDEYFDFSQIKVTDPAKIVVTGAGDPPDPIVVSAADVATGGPLQEAYEGVLVTVEGVTVASVDMMYGEFVTEEGLFVDDLFFAKADWTLPKVGDMFQSLTGPLAFNFSNAKLSPRSDADITP